MSRDLKTEWIDCACGKKYAITGSGLLQMVMFPPGGNGTGWVRDCRTNEVQSVPFNKAGSKEMSKVDISQPGTVIKEKRGERLFVFEGKAKDRLYPHTERALYSELTGDAKGDVIVGTTFTENLEAFHRDFEVHTLNLYGALGTAGRLALKGIR